MTDAQEKMDEDEAENREAYIAMGRVDLDECEESDDE